MTPARTMKLSRELWLRIEPLLGTALDMDPAPRTTWLAELDRTNPEVAPILRRMLESHERAQRTGEMETVPRLAAAPHWSSGHAAGARIGPFDLVSLLGHGGMGEVWLARQSDGRIERNVALKLPALNQQGATWRERFRRERDILARLEHPHIARLYDAGVTDGGQPWLAMEFVEGMTLSEHVASRAHSIRERLALFRQVLAAVAHAHRHLVVHRDLKPANILIDTSGQARLLDFGIAKLVEEGADAAGAGDLTRFGGRVMTLRYAAPEQVSGGAITTATDLYSLGVILHEMLTGLAPYRAVREGKALTDFMLTQEEIVVPSRLPLPKPVARVLAGDLDAILLKAMRRNPADRYASAEQFDADILAHMEKRPVTARAGTSRYLAGRFAARHKLPLATAAAIVVTLLAGLVMAERERNVAVAEKARAERHFASVRKLANTFIFDVHGEIEKLPGSLKAREMLVKTSLEYLDALAAEGGRDAALMFEIAAAYRNIGNIQGEPGAANRGDPKAAIGNFEKAKRLFVTLEAAKPEDMVMAREHRKLSYALARGYFLAGDPRWKAEIAENTRLATRIAAQPGATLRDRSVVAIAMGEEANLTSISAGRNPAVEAAVAKSIAILDSLVAEAPEQSDLRHTLAGMHLRAGRILGGPGRTAESLQAALVHSSKARAMARDLREAAPGDATRQAAELDALGVLAKVQELAGDLQQADRTIAEALALSAELAARDPSDVTLAVDRMNALVGAAEVALRLGDRSRAIRLSRGALEVAARLPADVVKTREVRGNIINAKVGLGFGLLDSAGPAAGDRHRRLALLGEARALFTEVAAFIAEVQAENPKAIPEDELKQFKDALRRTDEAIARLKAA